MEIAFHGAYVTRSQRSPTECNRYIRCICRDPIHQRAEVEIAKVWREKSCRRGLTGTANRSQRLAMMKNSNDRIPGSVNYRFAQVSYKTRSYSRIELFTRSDSLLAPNSYLRGYSGNPGLIKSTFW